MVFVTYAEYLTTTGWRARSWMAMDRAAWRCETPGCASESPLQTHHLSYARLGKERDNDLIVLCEECHARRHGLLDEAVEQLPLPLRDTVH
jgi:5-methylcytosine-specific restriction endonuclease McrA